MFEEVRQYTANHGLGGFFIIHGEDHIIKEYSEILQKVNPHVPSIVAADLENGAGKLGGTEFPSLLALGAADDEDLAYQLGKATALEGRSLGIHWTYAPVIDVIMNPDNPITQDRAMGSDPEKIGRLAVACLRGMQEHGLAACVKHFPGDGVDSRDQHLTTTVNSLGKEEWHRIYGTLYRKAIDAGVWSVMAGHIALPAYCSKKAPSGLYTPATLSKELTTDLLRGELGFKGLVVSDSALMGGFSCAMKKRDRVIEAFNAGCDMLLFAENDFPEILLEGVETNRITTERLDEAVGRILSLKEKLGLLEGKEGRLAGPEPEEQQAFQQSAVRIAGKSLVLVQNRDGAFPADIPVGAKILTVTLAHKPLHGERELPVIDEELRARGFEVTHLLNPGFMPFRTMYRQFDRVFINFLFPVDWGTGTTHSFGPQNRIFISGLVRECAGKAIYTSFGYPFHLREFPQIPCYINAHSGSGVSQREAVKAWLGDINISGNKSPVTGLTMEQDPV